jgi:hypothetical protein
VSDLEWAVIGYDKQEQCEFIDTTPDDREHAYYQLRHYYTRHGARVVCRAVSEWRTPTDEEAGDDRAVQFP